MGTDIHLFVERRNNRGRWELVEPPERPLSQADEAWRWGPGMRHSHCYHCDSRTGAARDEQTWMELVAPLLNRSPRSGLFDLTDLQAEALELTPDGRATAEVLRDLLDDLGASDSERRALRVMTVEDWTRNPGGCPRCLHTGRDLRWYGERNYMVFYMLTGTVRGSDKPAPAITAQPRGVPKDAGEYVRRFKDQIFDHSPSYLTVSELLAHDWTVNSGFKGVIPYSKELCGASWPENKKSTFFVDWDGKQPESWSGWIGGGGIRVFSEEAARGFTQGDLEQLRAEGVRPYVQVSWSTSTMDWCAEFVQFVRELLVPLGPPDDVRIVFGFDS